VSRHGDHRLLMILGAFDSLVQPHHMDSPEAALVDHDQVADLHKGPFQIPVHVSADLAHTRVTAAGMYAWNQSGVAGQMRSGGKPIYSADLQHQNHAEDFPYTGQCLQQIRLDAHFHDCFEPLLCRFDLYVQEIECRQLLLDRFTAVLRQFRQSRSEQPTSCDAEQIRSWHLHVVTCQSAVDTILYPRAQVDQKDTQAE